MLALFFTLVAPSLLLQPRASTPPRAGAPVARLLQGRDRDSWFPQEDLTPVEVVELQLCALQASDARVYWRFVSPDLKRAIGIKKGYSHNSRFPYLMPPELRKMPVYIPLLGASRFQVVGALATGESSYQVRARVWPAGGERECGGEVMPAQPVEAVWRLALQPLVRPSCYEDDPMQMGVSTGPPFGGCWLADDVRLDDRWGGGDDGDARGPSDHGGGGTERKLPTQQRILAAPSSLQLARQRPRQRA